jgi:hypothetical protein
MMVFAEISDANDIFLKGVEHLHARFIVKGHGDMINKAFRCHRQS